MTHTKAFPALLSFLEKLGIDTSADANRDDAIALGFSIALLAGFVVSFYYPWVGGFAIGMTITAIGAYVTVFWRKPRRGETDQPADRSHERLRQHIRSVIAQYPDDETLDLLASATAVAAREVANRYKELTGQTLAPTQIRISQQGLTVALNIQPAENPDHE